MAAKKKTQRRPAPKASGPSRGRAKTTNMSDPKDLSMADLDQVRNILFGRQMKASEKRVDDFERTLKKELQALRGELGKRMDAMERALTQQTAALEKRVAAEEEERVAGEEALTKRLGDLKKTSEEKFARLNELNTRTARELRERIVRDVKATREEFGVRVDELAEELGSEAAELRETSVGKEDLSAFLGDIALKLVNKKQIRRS